MFRRILLKLSGEVLQGEEGQGFDYKKIDSIVEEIKSLKDAEHEVAIVIGAGNIWRYRDTKDSGLERTTSDTLGMLGTVMNSVVLQSAIEKKGLQASVFSALLVPKLTQVFQKKEAVQKLQEGEVVICAGGTGNPFFTTDSAAALRALELECDLIIKATKVDGVYDSDPEKNSNAQRYEHVSFQEVIEKNLKVMDQAAFSLCKEGDMPIVVLNMDKKNAILRAAQGKKEGTLISNN